MGYSPLRKSLPPTSPTCGWSGPSAPEISAVTSRRRSSTTASCRQHTHNQVIASMRRPSRVVALPPAATRSAMVIHPPNRGVALFEDRSFLHRRRSGLIALDRGPDGTLGKEVADTRPPTTRRSRHLRGWQGHVGASGRTGIRGLSRLRSEYGQRSVCAPYRAAPGEPGSETGPLETSGRPWRTGVGHRHLRRRHEHRVLGRETVDPGSAISARATTSTSRRQSPLTSPPAGSRAFQYNPNESMGFGTKSRPDPRRLSAHRSDNQRAHPRGARRHLWFLERTLTFDQFVEGTSVRAPELFRGLDP